MNTHITSEINAQFIAAGSTRMAAESPHLDYYHCKTGLYLHYSPDLQDAQFHAVINSTEVVIVVASDDAMVMAIDRDLPCEVVKLQDLPQFLAYRTLSEECFKYRIAKQCYDSANEDFYDACGEHERANYVHEYAVSKFSAANSKLSNAREEFEQANDIHKEATVAFWSHPKPPRFRPAAI